MVAGSRFDGGSQLVSYRIRKTIQSIKEIVGNHSDSDIYAMLKETNMDPNETAQKLLNQDPFHEVKRKRDKKKEHTGYKSSSDSRKQVEHSIQTAKSHAPWFDNDHRRAYTRNPTPDAGVSREFRVVRDNRVNQNMDNKLGSSQHPPSGNEQLLSNIPDKSFAGVPTDEKLFSNTNLDGYRLSEGLSGSGLHSTDASPSGSSKPLLPEQTHDSFQNSQAKRKSQYNLQKHSKPTLTSSVAGVCSSSSDPVHVPSPDYRLAGTVRAIGHEAGVKGLRRQRFDRSATKSPSSMSSTDPMGKDISSSVGSSDHSASMSKGSQFIQMPASQSTMHSTSTSRSSSGTQHYNKVHQQSMGRQKVVQPYMEWKPKTCQKPTIESSVVIGKQTASHTDNTSNANMLDAVSLSEKLLQANISEDQHVIIPLHLQVPESERTRLTFGSFGAGFDSAAGATSAIQESESSKHILSSLPMDSSKVVPDTEHKDVDDDAKSPDFESSTSAVESEESLPENESFNVQGVESYADIGLVRSNSPPFNSAEAQELQEPASLPNFTTYDRQTSYTPPFLKTVMESNHHSQGLNSTSEAQSMHAASNSSSMAVGQQQQPVQPQQVTQLYPQVHISHYPNFMPYRHIFSPVYVPPMALPNYSANPAYPHPSNGNNYVIMPGGSSQLTAGGMKYTTSQYKSVPPGSTAGYGNYTNPAGFTINPPGTIGGAPSIEDVTRIKYKDNSLYVPNPQAETSDIWIQTPRELPSLQASPYYNLPGQTPHAAFMPTHPSHPSFNATAQSSHVHYGSLYHPPQATPIGSPHPLVPQQAPPPMGGSIGVGVAAPGPQLGAYQQPQLGHLNWTTNF
ncbi:uncharacterized protein [Typha angustifolia]|uniref:uncharacterized protein isoform X2 n=1 Tax=Typha angustifolia TaxID=59011 RepID=UPI003C2DEB6F